MDLTSRLDAEHLAVYRAMPEDLLAGLIDDLPATRDRAAALAAAVTRPPWPAGVTTEDRYAPGPAGAPDVLVRVYRPEGLPSPAAALYWVHGGGMVMGSIAMNDDMCALHRRPPEDRRDLGGVPAGAGVPLPGPARGLLRRPEVVRRHER